MNAIDLIKKESYLGFGLFCVSSLLGYGFLKYIERRYLTRVSRPVDVDEGAETPALRIGDAFENPWPTWRGLPQWIPYLKYCIFQAPRAPDVDDAALDHLLPILEPDASALKEPSEDVIRFTWLGHATCLVQMQGFNILTDPHFSDRCFFVQFAGPKRYRRCPMTISDLPPIDAVLISHNHYDHLDLNSVLELEKRFGADLRWFVPLGLGAWFKESGVGKVVELDWWEETTLINGTAGSSGLKLAFTPTQHWSSRSPWDRNLSLWGSWVVIGPRTRFWFGGDTAYCPVFRQIGRKYGPFDLAAIPVGAYEPASVCSNQHVNPEEATRVHRDVRSRRSVGIHWGTFVLSSERIMAPCKDLEIAREMNGMGEEEFSVLKHGETILIEAQ